MNGLPDDPTNVLGTGIKYQVKCPDPNNPNHDDRGHVIIARITQNTDEDGVEYAQKPVQYSDPVSVYTPLDTENQLEILFKGNGDRPQDGDKIFVDTDASYITVEWHYDDNGDGIPDSENPVSTADYYIVWETQDKGHTFIAVVKQIKKADGTDYPEGEAPTVVTKPIKVHGYLPGEYVPLDENEELAPTIPNKQKLENGDEIKIETDATDVIVKWYYDDNEDGTPDDLTKPIGEGKTYTLKCPDQNDPTHDDRDHKIIAVIEQKYDEFGDNYPIEDRPTVYSKTVTNIIPTHTHSFTYTANGATITAKCNTAKCPITTGLTLELVAPTGSMVYDGNARVATLKAGYNTEVFENATIKYFQGNKEVTTCVAAGTYVAKVTIGTATAQLSFVIENWTEKDAAHTEVEAEIVGVSKDENVHLKVDVKTTINAQTSQTDYEKIQKLLANNESISKVYDVKLIRTVNGESKEIQPSEIKEGTTLIVTMDIPTELVGKDFRILHIHSVDDAEFINNYTVSGNKVSFSITRLSEFAFVVAKVNTNHGFCVGWVLFIFVIFEALLLLAYVPQVLRKLGLENKQELLQNIGVFTAIALMVFGIVAIIADGCAISIISYSLAMGIGLCHLVFVVLKIRKPKTN